MCGSYTYADRNTAEDECIGIYGISERKEQSDNTPKAWEFKIQVWEQKFLVQRILCRYCREECQANSRIHTKSAKFLRIQ